MRSTLAAFGVLVTLIVADAWLLSTYGINCPQHDGWSVVWYLQPVPPSLLTLFQPHNEHVLPLPRVILVGIAKLTGGNFLVAPWLSLAMLSAASFGLLIALRRLRGTTHWADAIVPAAMLNWGHAENLLNAWQLQFTLSVALLAFITAEMIYASRHSTTLAGMATALLPFCGAQGILFALPVCCWMTLTKGWRGFVFACIGMAACLVCRPGHSSFAFDLRNVAACFSLAFGPSYIPGVRGLPTLLNGFGAMHLCLLSSWEYFAAIGLLVSVLALWFANRTNRGLAAIMAGCILAAVAIGSHREVNFFTKGFSTIGWGMCPCSRYSLLFVMLPVVAYVVFSVSSRRALASGLACLVFVSAALSTPGGLAYAKQHHHIMETFLLEEKSGQKSEQLAREHVAMVYTHQPTEGDVKNFAYLIDTLRSLHHPSFNGK